MNYIYLQYSPVARQDKRPLITCHYYIEYYHTGQPLGRHFDASLYLLDIAVPFLYCAGTDWGISLAVPKQNREDDMSKHLWIAGFDIPDEVREVMRKLYPPIFPAIHLRTITIAYGVEADYALPSKPVEITVVATVEQEATQALAVSVGDHLRRPDGLPYFVAVSAKPGVSPKLAGAFEFNEVKILPPKLMFKFRALARLSMRRPARTETAPPSEVRTPYWADEAVMRR